MSAFDHRNHTHTHTLTSRRPLCRPVSSRGRCGRGRCSRCWWTLPPYTWRIFLLWSRQSCSRGTDPCVWSSRRNLWQCHPRTLQDERERAREREREKETSWWNNIFMSNSWKMQRSISDMFTYIKSYRSLTHRAWVWKYKIWSMKCEELIRRGNYPRLQITQHLSFSLKVQFLVVFTIYQPKMYK